MELNVAQALRQVGQTVLFSIVEPVACLEYNGRVIELSQPLQVHGTAVFDGSSISVDAHAETVLRERCARCGETYEGPYAFPVKERFAKADTPGEDDVYPYQGEKLELTQAVLDNFYLHLPLTNLCQPDCRGLCPICGANLNVESCACQPNEGNGPFAALAALTHRRE